MYTIDRSKFYSYIVLLPIDKLYFTCYNKKNILVTSVFFFIMNIFQSLRQLSNKLFKKIRKR